MRPSVPRTLYARQLDELRGDVVALASMVDKATGRAVEALRLQDLPLARRVVADDRAVNALRFAAEERALLLIATQAPVAGDLRFVAAVIHIATDLERMADHAVGVAKAAIATADEPLIKPLVDLPRMADIARAMLADSITAFIGADATAARAIVARDDEVDALYDQVYRELLTFMLGDPRTIRRATRLLGAAHHLERIADRVTNVCERVVFAVTGTVEETG